MTLTFREFDALAGPLCLGVARVTSAASILQAEQPDRGQSILRFAAANSGTIAEAEIIELPQELHVDVLAQIVDSLTAVGAAGKGAESQRPRDGCGPAAHEQAGHQGPEFFLAQQDERVFHLGAVRGQLRTIPQAQDHQVVHGLAGVEQGDQQMRRLQRGYLAGGVEPQ